MGKGIFKADRIKFLLHLLHKIFPEQMPDQEWSIFLGQHITGNKLEARESVPVWLPEITVQAVYSLKVNLPNLYESLKLNDQVSWKFFMETKSCEAEFPTHLKLSEFQKVLVVQALRPDRLYSSLYSCVLVLTGKFLLIILIY